MENKNKKYIINKLTQAEIFEYPFFHTVIDDFLPESLAEGLFNEFPSYDSDVWFNYNNKIEHKRLLSDWRKFPKLTYQTFTFFNSNWMLETLSSLAGDTLYSDQGLHGGGWHIHSNGGKLNPHLDYSIHPMLGLQRKLNLIVYLCKDWMDEYGGHFGLWSQNSTNETQSGDLIKEIPVKFNRAVLFDTTQQSWHGLSREVSCPDGMYRMSLATYYLNQPMNDTDPRSRALFSPTEDQKNDEDIKELILKRADFNKSKEVYLG